MLGLALVGLQCLNASPFTDVIHVTDPYKIWIKNKA